jgi:hypothetical protein
VSFSLHPSFGNDYLNFKCEGEVVINFPPPNGWANKTGQSNLRAIFTMHNELSSK